MAVERQPVDHFVHHLALRGESLAIQDMAHGEAHLEIVAAVRLRDELRLSNENSMVVEVGGDEKWWRVDI